MAGKIIDITEKLEFAENPVLKIGKDELEVNTDAMSVLKIMGYVSDENGINAESVSELINTVFTEKSAKRVREMHLNFDDLSTVIREAVNAATGMEDEEEEGNLQTPDTIS